MRLTTRGNLPNLGEQVVVRSCFSQLLLYFFFQLEANPAFRDGRRDGLRVILVLLNQSYDFI
jgi:hypothetical protein